MQRRLGPAILLLAAALPASGHAQRVATTDCSPIRDLVLGHAEPVLRQVAAGAGRVHFAQSAPPQRGDPFVVPGDAVVVTGTRGDAACATYAGLNHDGAPTSGWLPSAALIFPPPPLHAEPEPDGGWPGDWRAGPAQSIRIRSTPDGRIALDGEATVGGGDPAHVQRGAVGVGAFRATVAVPGGQLAFLLGGEGRPLPYDAQRAKDDRLCALKFWRLGPYMVAADNLQCGGKGVTFAGIYRRFGKPS